MLTLLALALAEGGGGGLLSVDVTLLWATIVVFVLFAWVLGGDVRTFSPREQHDDITLIVARCRER